MSKASKVTVDYASKTAEAARANVRKVATAYKRWSGQEGDRTTDAAVALADARHAGYLFSGLASDRPAGSISLAGYAEVFGVSRATTTFWNTLSVAYDSGVQTDSDTWKILAVGKAARSGDVSGKVKEGASPDAIHALLTGLGWSVDKHGKVQHATPQGTGARNSKAGQTDEPEKDSPETPADPFEAGKAALTALAVALKSLPVEKADEWAALRKGMVAILKREDTLRHTTPTPVKRTASKRTASKRTASRAA